MNFREDQRHTLMSSFMAVLHHLYKQKTSTDLQQLLGSAVSCFSSTSITFRLHTRLRSFLQAIPVALLKDRHSRMWLVFSVNWSFFTRDEKEGSAQLFPTPLKHFVSIIMDGGIYREKDVSIFLSHVMQSIVSLVAGRGGAWPGAAGKSQRKLLTITC